MVKNWQDGPDVTTDLFRHLVAHRGIPSDTSFLNPVWPNDLHDPLLLPDAQKAIQRIWRAIEHHEHVGIVGDYDMDGTPAASLLYDFFQLVGLRPTVIIPTREDGYGFSVEFAETLTKAGCTLIITVDCGTKDSEAINLAQSRNADVIVTDHHECPGELPQAYALVNPKRRDSQYPFRELCGTGVIYKVIEGVWKLAPSTANLPETWLAWSLDLVAMATLSDMVPLLDENRLFVRYGLKVIQKAKRPGLRRFIESLDLHPADLTYQDITFKLAPKFNAAGRMEGMRDVFTILTSKNTQEIDAAIQRVLICGTQSKIFMERMLEEAQAQLAVQADDAAVLVAADPGWHPGLTGLVAGRLMDLFGKPVGVFAQAGDEYRGSFRSPKGINLPTLLEPLSEHILRFGGHEQAAGLSVSPDKFNVFSSAVAQSSLRGSEGPRLVTDGVIRPSQATLDSLELLDALTPWGMEHHEPLWSLQRVRLDAPQWLKDGQHLKAVVRGEDGSELSLIYFGASHLRPHLSGVFDLYGTLSINAFRNQRTPQFMVKGVGLAGEV